MTKLQKNQPTSQPKALFYLLVLALLTTTAVFTSCKKDEDPAPNNSAVNSNIVPDRFSIAVPSSISAQNASGKTSDILSGDSIYQQLRVFVFAGTVSAAVNEGIIKFLHGLKIENPVTITFTSNDDSRRKTLNVAKGVTRNGVNWEYELIITDSASGGQAMQLLWNRAPVKGISILNPYNLNRKDNLPNTANAFWRIDYSEEKTATYDATMTVYLSRLADNNANDKGFMDNLKLFVGKKGNTLDLIGASNHPRLTLIDSSRTGGMSYNFVGRSDEVKNIAAVELGLPPSGVEGSDTVLQQYSVYKVLDGEIKTLGITNQALIDLYLANTRAPGYFVGRAGFMAAGPTIPTGIGFTQEFINFSTLRPYSPKEVRDMAVGFQQ